jgi:serine/threonine protein kinase
VSTRDENPVLAARLVAVPAPGMEPGQTIGNYRLVRNVGVGGMAQVFLATREGPEGFAKRCVVKRILPALSRDDRFASMFVVEAKVAAMLDHPNIVHVFDFEVESGNYYLVMEYITGASLGIMSRASRRQGRPLGAEVAVEVGVGIASALAYAHDLKLPDGRPLGLVHRDISPGNVLVSRDGLIKLADFGVVKTTLAAPQTGMVSGKWPYMSPEQVRGRPVDRRSDLFSLGIVLYEVITGVRLFRGESSTASATLVTKGPIKPPQELIPDLDPQLSGVILKLLERDPDARYQDAAELARDFEHLHATLAFSDGRRRLRALVRELVPEDELTPALGASVSSVRAPGENRRTTSSGLSANFADHAQWGTAALDDDPDAVTVRGSNDKWSRKTLILVIVACVVTSGLFWLAFL